MTYKFEGLTINQLAVRNAEPVMQNEELQRKVEALAVECANAKQVITECKSYFIAGIRGQIRPTNEGYLHMRCDTFLDETPATDAALAEIRAQGVDALIEMKLKHLENMHPDTHAFGASAMEIRAQVNEMQAFVQQLGKEDSND